jgi:hypothetical protein
LRSSCPAVRFRRLTVTEPPLAVAASMIGSPSSESVDA